jgi:acetyl-CoA acetyltransferase
MSDIYIAGIAMTVFGRHFERSIDDLAGEALRGALKDAGCDAAAIGAAFYAGITNGPLQGQLSIPGQIVFSKIGIEGIPVYNVENACASGSTAVHLAAQALRSGACDVVLALGAEKMNVPDKAKSFALFEAGWDVSRVDENFASLMRLGEGIEPPPGSESDRPYSRFMSVYAALCRYHMKTYGTTQRQIAAVSAKNHLHSVHNPYSQFRQPFTIDEVLAAPPITYPITLPMCAPVSDGAAAAIVCTEEGLRRIGADRRRCVKIAASVIRSFTHRRIDEPEKNIGRLAALQAYDQAGLGPEDVDVASRPKISGSYRSARADPLPSAASSRSAAAFPSTRPAASNRKATRWVRRESVSSMNWLLNCVEKRARGRYPARVTRFRKTAAAFRVSRKPRSRSTF